MFFSLFSTVYIYVIIQQRQSEIILFSFKKPIYVLYHFLPNGNFKKKHDFTRWLRSCSSGGGSTHTTIITDTAAVWMPVASSSLLSADQKRFVLKIKTYAPYNVIILSWRGVYEIVWIYTKDNINNNSQLSQSTWNYSMRYTCKFYFILIYTYKYTYNMGP